MIERLLNASSSTRMSLFTCSFRVRISGNTSPIVLREHVHEFDRRTVRGNRACGRSDGAAQDAAQDVVAVGVAGMDAVGDGEAQRADMVGDDAEGDIDLFLLGVASAAGVAGSVDAYFLPLSLFEFVEDRAEDVGFVVGDLGVGEIGEAFRALNDGGDALEAHAGIDMLGGQRRETCRRVRVELDEDQVPDLDALGTAFVHERAFGVALRREVDVDFGARTARAGFAHHPEIVFFVAVDDVDFGVEAGGAEFLRPKIPRFLVEFARIAFGFVRAVNRGVEAVRREFPDLGDQFPGPVDGFLFEIIAEATSCRASRRTCGDTCRGRHPRGRCACRRRECISACRARAAGIAYGQGCCCREKSARTGSCRRW